jgi:hypothetical protein
VGASPEQVADEFFGLIEWEPRCIEDSLDGRLQEIICSGMASKGPLTIVKRMSS